jgi:hypothetical protein
MLSSPKKAGEYTAEREAEEESPGAPTTTNVNIFFFSYFSSAELVTISLHPV